MNDKAALRKILRAERDAHVAMIPETVRALIFKRPPAPLIELIPQQAIIGIYHAKGSEAPADGYARFFAENGHTVALPSLTPDNPTMIFAEHSDPFSHSDLEPGPHGLLQPDRSAAQVVPDVVFVPLLAFTNTGARLGQGGGYYDRWLSNHRGTIAIGMGWDSQKRDTLPEEPHDIGLHAVVTPTRLYGPF